MGGVPSAIHMLLHELFFVFLICPIFAHVLYMYLHVCISEVILTPFPQHAFHFEKLKSSVIRTHLFLEKLLVKVRYMTYCTCTM